jgi:hypothetical protein
VLVSGPGASARNTIGIVLVSGMAIGTLFRLLILPAVYLRLAGVHEAETPGHPARELAPLRGMAAHAIADHGPGRIERAPQQAHRYV